MRCLKFSKKLEIERGRTDTDFVSDALFDGRRFRTLPIIDVFTRECIDITADQSICVENVVNAFEK